jgi:hypothetical protein
VISLADAGGVGVATLEDAKEQFQKSLEQWKAWAKLEEVP